MKRLCSFLFLFFIGLQARSNSILMVGDSLTCGPFGQKTALELSQKGHEVVVYCAVSTSAFHWINGENAQRTHGKTWPCTKMVSIPGKALFQTNCDGSDQVPHFNELLKKYPQHDVLIALGTNSLPGLADFNYDQMMNLASQNRSRSCTWIGPPHVQRPDLESGLGSFYKSLRLKAEKESCQLIDSRPATAQGTLGYASVPDRVHKTVRAGFFWATTLSQEIESSVIRSGRNRISPKTKSENPRLPKTLNNDVLQRMSYRSEGNAR